MSLMAFLVVTAFSSANNFAMPVLLFYLPWSKILRASPTSYSFFTVALLMVCTINLMMRGFRIKRYAMTGALVLAVLTLLSKLIDGSALTLEYIMFLVMVALFPLVKGEQDTDSYDYFILVLFLSTGVAMAALCAQQFAGYDNVEKYIRVDAYLTIKRRCGFYGDPNFYSAQITAAMAGCMVLILQIKNKWKVTLLCALFAVLLYCGLLSGSKSFVLVFACLLLLWLYQLVRMRGRKIMKTLLSIGIAAFAFYVVTSELFRELIDVIITRLSLSKNFSKFTTGRTELWAMYFEFLAEDWKAFLLGVGCTNIKVNGYASHSTILQSWYQFGAFGIVPLIVWYYHFMTDGATKMQKGQGISTIILVTGVFVPWLAIDMLLFDEFFLFSVYVFLGINRFLTQKEGSRQHADLRTV